LPSVHGLAKLPLETSLHAATGSTFAHRADPMVGSALEPVRSVPLGFMLRQRGTSIRP
jgi:hypothetical protein